MIASDFVIMLYYIYVLIAKREPQVAAQSRWARVCHKFLFDSGLGGLYFAKDYDKNQAISEFASDAFYVSENKGLRFTTVSSPLRRRRGLKRTKLDRSDAVQTFRLRFGGDVD
jgi:hypothetical protein